MTDTETAPAIYEITVEGTLEPHFTESFSPLTLSWPQAQETVLRGVLPDQAALYGVLKRINNLGLALKSVQKLMPEDGGRQ